MISEREPSVAMLKEMLDAVDAAVYAFDKDRKVIYANKATATMLEFANPGTNIGAAQSNHFDDNQYFDEQGNLLPYPKGSSIELAFEGKETQDLILEHRNIKEHKHRWISISCIPINDSRGAFQYGLMVYRDISAQKSRDNKFRFLIESAKILSVTADFKQRLREKARLAVPSLADWCAIDIHDSDGSISRAALVHRDPSRIAYAKEFDAKYPTKPGEESVVQRVIRTGKPEFIPFLTDKMVDSAPDLTDQHRTDIKQLGITSFMVVPIGVRGHMLGAFTAAYAESGRLYTQDDVQFFTEFGHHLSILIDNARLYSEIKQRDVAKDTFLASLSHELRNPLAPIKSALELLKLKQPNALLMEDIQVIDHQFDHMTRLLNDLLDSTRFTQGKIKLDIEPMEVTTIVEHVVQAARPVADAAHIRIHLTLPQTLLHLSADRTRIEQALSNLLHNAIKFTPNGGSVFIDLQADTERVSITIRDTGMGITENEMSHIFEPYYQGTRTKDGNSGLGIGLRLVHEIARLHGGSIKVTSEGLDKGSQFVLSLPRVRNASQAPGTAAPESENAQVSNKVLVVDDNTIATDTLVRLLTALGQDTHGVYSAKKALEYLDHHDVDILFLDIGMPDMNGYELISLLRAQGKASIPIIALTGYGLKEDIERALAAGFTAHLTKPIGAIELRQVLNRVPVVPRP